MRSLDGNDDERESAGQATGPAIPSFAAASVIAAAPRNSRRPLGESVIVASALPDLLGPQRTEPVAELRREYRRLLPRREVPAFLEPVVMNHLRVRLLCPAARSGVDLVGED